MFSMSGFREGDSGGSRVVTAGSVVDKGLEHAALALFDAVSKGDEVDGDIVLLELLGQADHGLFVGPLALERRGDKDDDTLTKVLVLSVLECELGYGDGSGNIGSATNLACGGMECLENLTNVLGVCYEDLWATQAKEVMRGRSWGGRTVTHPLPAIVMTPTVFSGLESILVWKMVLTASCCASKREGW